MNTNIKTREYTTISEVSGPLMVVEGVEGVGYNEIVAIETPNGEKRSGQVLEVTDDVAVIQVFEGTTDLNTKNTKVLMDNVYLPPMLFITSTGDDVMGEINIAVLKEIKR